MLLYPNEISCLFAAQFSYETFICDFMFFCRCKICFRESMLFSCIIFVWDFFIRVRAFCYIVVILRDFMLFRPLRDFLMSFHVFWPLLDFMRFSYECPCFFLTPMRFPYEISCFLAAWFSYATSFWDFVFFCRCCKICYEISCFLAALPSYAISCFFAVTRCPYEMSGLLALMRFYEIS